MSNNINTQNTSIDNVIAAKKLNRGSASKVVKAADSLPKYSLYSELKKNDEFRKSVRTEIHSTKTRENRHKKTAPIIKFLAATALVLFITRK